MQLTLTLCLPRDELTVPVARHIIRSSMRTVGVTDDCISEIEIALSEACTNVLKHSGPGDEYEVTLELDTEKAVLVVVDRGNGFDVSGAVDGPRAEATAERGRGIELMRALVDEVKFASKPETGTVVHLEKTLEFHPSSPVHRLPSA